MSEPNREALGRMVKTVVAAARKAGISDDEIRVIVDAELLGGESAPAEMPAKVPSIEGIIAPARPGGKPRSDSEIIPELEGPVPGLDAQGDARIPLGLESLFKIDTPPYRIKAPPKTSWDKYAAGDGPVPGGPPGDPK